MEFSLKIEERVDRKLKKLCKKNKQQFLQVRKKLQQIRLNPHHFKPLRSSMKGLRRVHIDSSFVLTYEIIGNEIRIIDFDHHDRIYKS